MRTNQITITVERFGDQAPESEDSSKHQVFSVYCDSNNIYEALAGAYKSVIDEIEKSTKLPSFGARETYHKKPIIRSNKK